MAPVLKRKAPSSSVDDLPALSSNNSKKAKSQSSKRKPSPPAKPTIVRLTFTSINNLPFDCFCVVFGRFPLRTLLPLRLVSRTWNGHISQICARKERLTIIPYTESGPHLENGQDLYWTDDLKRYVANRTENRHDCIEFRITRLGKIPIRQLREFFQLFEGVTEIRLHYDCKFLESHVKLVGKLIRSLASDRMRSFQFLLPTNPELIFQNHIFVLHLFGEFYKSLNRERFPALNKLDLCIVYDRSYFIRNMKFLRGLNFGIYNYSNNILVQLERFSLDFAVKNSHREQMLRKLGPQLTHLSMECERFHRKPPLDLLDNVQFHQLTHLRLDNLPASPTMLQLFCDRFHGSLQSVQLKLSARVYKKDIVENVFDSKWFEALLKLDHLTELRLHSFKLFNQFADSPATTPPPSLPTVTKLILCESTLLHQYYHIDSKKFNSDQLCRSLAEQFPALKELIIVCTARWFWNNSLAELEHQIRQNLQRNLVHLRSCVLDLAAPEFDYVPR